MENTSGTIQDTTLPGISFVPEGCVLKQTPGVFPGEESEDDDSLTAKQADTIVQFLLLGICLPLCFLLSFSTNIVNMAVFWKQGLTERINMLLFSLSLLDLLYVVVVYAINMDAANMFLQGQGSNISPFSAFFFRTRLIGLIAFETASTVVSSLVALERCLCVTRPLLVKNLMSTRRTAVALWLLLSLLLAARFVTAGLRLTVRCVFDAGDNSTSYQYFPTRFYIQNRDMIHFLGGLTFGIVLPALCVVSVSVCTLIMAAKLRTLSAWRETVSSASQDVSSRDSALTRMIVATSVLFIACNVPSITVRVAANLVPGLIPGGRYEALFMVLTRVYFLASVVNSTVNFFVYYVYGSRFRQAVRELAFLACCSKAQKRARSGKSQRC